LEKSENISELVKSLIKVQACLKPASGDKTNPFFKTGYADLSGLWWACRSLLQQNSLAVVQLAIFNDEGANYLETLLAHASGQWISGRYPLKLADTCDPRVFASALTCARGYGLAAVLGIVTADDDAEAAATGHPDCNCFSDFIPRAEHRRYSSVANGPATQKQLDRIEIFKKRNINIEKIIELYNWKNEKPTDLSFGQAERVIRECVVQALTNKGSDALT
jgi:hypothetical protein